MTTSVREFPTERKASRPLLEYVRTVSSERRWLFGRATRALPPFIRHTCGRPYRKLRSSFFVILRDFAASAAALPCIGLHRRFIRRTLEAAYSPELRTPMDIYAAALLVGLSCMSATLAACLIVLAIDPKK